MSIKVLAGILLFIAGLGLGVIDWVRGGFSGTYPLLGLAVSAVGVYLIADGLRRRASPRVSGKEVMTAAGLMAGIIAGTLLVSELKRRQSKLSPQEILELEKMLEEARITGKVSPQKYAQLKAELEDIKRRRGIK